jgi:hypothetical protein
VTPPTPGAVFLSGLLAPIVARDDLPPIAKERVALLALTMPSIMEPGIDRYAVWGEF